MLPAAAAAARMAAEPSRAAGPWIAASLPADVVPAEAAAPAAVPEAGPAAAAAPAAAADATAGPPAADAALVVPAATLRPAARDRGGARGANAGVVYMSIPALQPTLEHICVHSTCYG